MIHFEMLTSRMVCDRPAPPRILPEKIKYLTSIRNASIGHKEICSKELKCKGSLLENTEESCGTQLQEGPLSHLGTRRFSHIRPLQLSPPASTASHLSSPRLICFLVKVLRSVAQLSGLGEGGVAGGGNYQRQVGGGSPWMAQLHVDEAERH